MRFISLSARAAPLAAVLLLLAGCGAVAGAQEPGAPIAALDRGTPLREYAGWLVFSRWDGTAYRLSTLHDGRLRDLPVPPQATAFDADAGPDSTGAPSVAVSLCDGDCDLYVIGLEPGEALRPVRNANTRGHDETDPSIWKGRLVYARTYGHDVVPYTKLLAAPRSRPSARLASLPDRRCGAIDPPSCRRIDKPVLAQMELYGRWVGQSWTYQPESFPGFRQNEIRLTDVARTDTRQVAAMTTGLSGQTYLGPSFASGRLAFFRACKGDPGGCRTSNSGALRYRISSGGYELAGANEPWGSWEWLGDGDLHTPSDETCGAAGPAFPATGCGIYRRPSLAWRPIAAEHVR